LEIKKKEKIMENTATDIKICTSINPMDYDILIRKWGLDNYASYCPQMNLILHGDEHEQVENAMAMKIEEHILVLQSSNSLN
jgi:hypothetical protein